MAWTDKFGNEVPQSEAGYLKKTNKVMRIDQGSKGRLRLQKTKLGLSIW